jgi:acyl carrier protein
LYGSATVTRPHPGRGFGRIPIPAARKRSVVVDTEPMRDFIRQKVLFDEAAQLSDDQEIFPGIVDSLGVLDLAEFVEKTYGVDIGDDELLVDNFRSLAAIAALVERKRG